MMAASSEPHGGFRVGRCFSTTGGSDGVSNPSAPTARSEEDVPIVPSSIVTPYPSRSPENHPKHVIPAKAGIHFVGSEEDVPIVPSSIVTPYPSRSPENHPKHVIPAKAGIHFVGNVDPRLRGGDEKDFHFLGLAKGPWKLRLVKVLAGTTGIEPATSCVTGEHRMANSLTLRHGCQPKSTQKHSWNAQVVPILCSA